jgi:hypothetical protein
MVRRRGFPDQYVRGSAPKGRTCENSPSRAHPGRHDPQWHSMEPGLEHRNSRERRRLTALQGVSRPTAVWARPWHIRGRPRRTVLTVTAPRGCPSTAPGGRPSACGGRSTRRAASRPSNPAITVAGFAGSPVSRRAPFRATSSHRREASVSPSGQPLPVVPARCGLDLEIAGRVER